MTMNDDFLNKFRKAPRPEFAASLYQRISKPMQTQTKPGTLRFAALTLSLLAVLTATLFLSPSARAFAQSLLHQIGGYAFTSGIPQPLDASRVAAPINIIKTSTSTSIEITGESILADAFVTAGDIPQFS